MTRKNHSRRQQQDKRKWLWPVLLFLGAFLPAFWVYHSLFSPLDLPPGYQLEVERGTTLNQLAERLETEGILPNALLLKLWIRLQAEKPSLLPGRFALQPPLSAVGLLAQITASERNQAGRLVVIEGITFKRLLQQLAERSDIQHELLGLSDAQILQAMGVSETHPEGLFAPDTYQLGPNDSDLDILQRLYKQQQRILNEEWAGRAAGLPYTTPYEALIMASIVERETGVAAERPEIAGVFVRRLQQGMRLQTDPTVIYGMGDTYQGRIRREDLQRRTPYNTYRIAGLPPTPIALPGRAAIRAALNPAAGDALYFVARGDGSHVFSSSLSAHNAAVRQYQLKRAADYRSSPAPESTSP